MDISVMAAGTFRPKLREIFEASGKTVYEVAKQGGVDYNTAKRYLKEGGNERVTTDTLFGILRGLGYSWDEIRDMPLSDVYEIVPEDEVLAQ